MRALFMRHGETDYNRLGLCNGDPTRAVRLSPTGIAQAARAAESLRLEPIERIIVSELPRTRQTADIVNRYHGAPITVQPALNDIRSGFEDRPVVDYQRAIAADPLHSRPPGGELLLEHKARILGFLDWLAGQPERTLLVVGHEEGLRVVIAHFRGLPDEEMIRLSIGNCEWRVFEP